MYELVHAEVKPAVGSHTGAYDITKGVCYGVQRIFLSQNVDEGGQVGVVSSFIQKYWLQFGMDFISMQT